ncbi:Interleukin-20 receptor subunit beta [Dissostichus eleginoides]|uniref:Interleukin-20 receptor subunit beta n=1 Tax=Dissostichus eleginoides TaxID=100907 RepID=A0AAD9EUQ7_DISEL|nr:Interleukin-20 receptor subunit beta [Dissostichus eleginoides]
MDGLMPDTSNPQDKGVFTQLAPSRVFMESVDMRHVLKWRPLQASCSTAVLYSVQFQGEFELSVLNDSWVDALECQLTSDPRCDLTDDLGSDSDYRLRVKAKCGAATSAWTELSPPFNRRDTVLMAPEMSVMAVGDSLQVSFGKLPLNADVRVTVWRRDQEKAVEYWMPAEQRVLSVSGLQVAQYCVRAQTVLKDQNRSDSTNEQCISITGADAPWRKPTAVLLSVVFTAGFLLAVFWGVAHCHPDRCRTFFRKEPLPHSLKADWVIQIPISPEDAELCELIQVCSDCPSEDL